MPDGHSLIIFLVAALVLLLTPGPAVLYIVARSADQGRRAGLASVFGVAVGTLVHVVAAALGMSAVLTSSAVAFSFVKYLGAGYLIYLGIRRLLSEEKPSEAKTFRRQALRDIFTQGVIVNALNPKLALFFLAFLPQFVNVSRGSVALQMLFLGGLLIAMGILSDSIFALLAGTLGKRLKQNQRMLGVQRYITGSIYIALGIGAALTGRK
jgi:threonine/homoserine/homoserine lactone efflux protein